MLLLYRSNLPIIPDEKRESDEKVDGRRNLEET